MLFRLQKDIPDESATCGLGKKGESPLHHWVAGGLEDCWQVARVHATGYVPEKKCVTFLENENDLLICIIWHDCIVDRAIVREFRAWGMLLFLVSLLSMVSLCHAVVVQVTS